MSEAPAPFYRRHAAELLLAVLLLVGGAVLLQWHRSIGLWGDEWGWLLVRDGFGARQLLMGHNEHLMVLPVIVYKLIGAVFEPGANEPLAVLSVAMQCLVTVLVFVFVRRRSGAWPALGAAALVLFLGTGWEAVVWSFNYSWLAAMAAGLGALLVFERDEYPRGTLVTGLLLATAMACAGVGAVFLLGVLMHAIWTEHRRRALLATLPVIAIYAMWFVAYSEDDDKHGFYPGAIPDFFLDQAAAGFGGLLGDGLDWGRPIAVVAAVAALTVLARRERTQPADVVYVALPMVFWALTTIQRAGWADAMASRYVYTSGVLILMAVAQLAGRPRLNAVAVAGLTSVLLVALAGNFVAMRDGSALMRSLSGTSRAQLTAFALAGPAVRPPADYDPLDPGLDPRHVPRIYEWIEQGEPDIVWDRATVLASDETIRARVDETMSAITPLQAKSVEGSDLSGCRVLSGDGEFTASDSPLLIEGTAEMRVHLRRFASVFPETPHETLAAGAFELTVPLDAESRAWSAKIESDGEVRVCG